VGSAAEPLIISSADEFTVACPFCNEFGTHREACVLSMARTGEVFAVVAKRVTLTTRAPLGAPSEPAGGS
jgi:hypothetical protein